ncbi:hypothetical protein [Enterobacter cloacae complex sp. GF14B]|uniref:hypothetical protein n=1 Tax=Enterobacter cloacae complex sp. GF14B TaxID=2511982 RepID=UPI00100F0EBE|nr:hypothetical protein [Enterobacter cloacae complex sp. GF14B]RYA43635.1 hypothetical protein DD606_25310 [Enterobacter cloacae complex sp. GF14B]
MTSMMIWMTKISMMIWIANDKHDDLHDQDVISHKHDELHEDDVIVHKDDELVDAFSSEANLVADSINHEEPILALESRSKEPHQDESILKEEPILALEPRSKEPSQEVLCVPMIDTHALFECFIRDRFLYFSQRPYVIPFPRHDILYVEHVSLMNEHECMRISHEKLKICIQGITFHVSSLASHGFRTST